MEPQFQTSSLYSFKGPLMSQNFLKNEDILITKISMDPFLVERSFQSVGEAEKKILSFPVQAPSV